MPVHLNFFRIHFPITAWVSIFHRLSGAFLFFVLPVVLWGLQESLASPERFDALTQARSAKVVLWLILSSLFYHTLAGIRHLLMDAHLGDTKCSSVVSSWIVMVGFGVGIVGLGYWLW